MTKETLAFKYYIAKKELDNNTQCIQNIPQKAEKYRNRNITLQKKIFLIEKLLDKRL